MSTLSAEDLNLALSSLNEMHTAACYETIKMLVLSGNVEAVANQWLQGGIFTMTDVLLRKKMAKWAILSCRNNEKMLSRMMELRCLVLDVKTLCIIDQQAWCTPQLRTDLSMFLLRESKHWNLSHGERKTLQQQVAVIVLPPEKYGNFRQENLFLRTFVARCCIFHIDKENAFNDLLCK